MIKLVISDLDGCLLNDKKELPYDCFETIKKLNDKNIKFAIASGRSYPIIRSNFKNVIEDIYVITNNGAYISHNDHGLYKKTFPKDDVLYYLNLLEKDQEIYPIMCGLKYSYIKNRPIKDEIKKDISLYYPKMKTYDDFKEINDDIVMISIYDYRGSIDNAYLEFKDYANESYDIIPSAQKWMDICRKDVHKGSGVHELMKILNVTKDETMVFGDYLNDLTMIKEATYSYVPSNGHQDLKDLAYEVIGNNNDFSVIKKIKELL